MVQPGRLKNKIQLIIAVSIVLFISSCGTEPKEKVIVPEVEVKKIPAPDFNSDSAYAFIKAQVDFGPRVPGTSAHEKCMNYIIAKMKSYGMDVTVQTGSVVAYNGKTMPVKNIIA